MIDFSSSSRDTPIVTLSSIQGARQRESTALPEHGAGEKFDPVERMLLLGRYHRIIDEIEKETMKASPNVLVTLQNREASLLQSKIAEKGEIGSQLMAGGYEAKFGEGLTGGDWWGWLSSLLDHKNPKDAHRLLRPPDDKADTFPDRCRVAMLGDWGTNLYGARYSADSIMREGGYELLLHLGDIYYSGTKKEVKTRFLDVWPKAAGNISRALNGNHEMYSGGFAYFDDILSEFGQQSSYFALQNANWLLVSLDTAYVDHDIDSKQAAWLQTLVSKAGPRRIVLFSHHQLFSRLDAQGPKLRVALADLLDRKAVAAWYWGHEHQCVIYDRHAEFGLFGRCIGHGGIPSPRKLEVTNAPSDRSMGSVVWKRLSATTNSPSCFVLDGPNPYIKGEEEKFGPHGYVTLEFNGATLIERVNLPDGTEIYKGQIT